MVTFSTPLIGALALAAIPLVWWLHRRHGQKSISVPALFLWQAAAAAAPAVRSARRTDPVWVLRAAVCVTLLLALAGPGWRGVPPVTVWFDDALSMLAREGSATRTHQAIERLFELTGDRAFTLRLLRDPTALPPDGVSAGVLAGWLEARLADPPGAPVAPVLEPGREHWLVTDGAAEPVRRLLTESRFQRHVLVGETRENVAVTRLALRRPLQRPLQQPEQLPGLVTVANLGSEPARRTLRVHGDGAALFEQVLNLQPDQEQTVGFDVPAGVEDLSAELAEPDALAADDGLRTGLAALAPVPAQISAACPVPLLRALEHHPGIRVGADGAEAGLIIECGTQFDTPVAARRIRVHQAGPLQPAPAQREPNAEVVLQDGRTGRALVTAGSGGVDVYLDLDAGAWPETADYLALVDRIVSAAIGRASLDPLIELSRPADVSRIAPFSAVAEPATAEPVQVATDLSTLLLVLAALLLAADVAWARRSRRAPAAVPVRDGPLVTTAADG